MSLTSLTPPRNDHTGNGSQDTFAFTFRINSKAHLKVTTQNPAGAETPLTEGADFTVTGIGNDTGGTITLLDGPLPLDYKITLRRVVPNTQEFDIRNQGSYYPEDHEDAHDYGRMVDQQQQDEIDRSIKFPESFNVDGTLPSPVPNYALVINESKSGIALVPLVTTEAQLANQSEAEAGANNDKFMSPLRTKQAIDARLTTQPEAEAGVENTKLMTPLRAQQFFDSKLATQAEAEAGVINNKFISPLRAKQFYDANLASQAEAEAGVNNVKFMSALRTKQALARLLPDAPIGIPEANDFFLFQDANDGNLQKKALLSSFPPNDLKREMQYMKNQGAATATSLGFLAAPTLTATAASDDDANGPWLRHATTTTSGNPSGVVSTTFAQVRPEWLPEFSARVRPLQVTPTGTYTFIVGFFSASVDATGFLASTPTDTPAIHIAAFVAHLLSGGPNFFQYSWIPYTSNGTAGAGNSTATPADWWYTNAQSAAPPALLKIVFVTPTQVDFFIDGIRVASHTTTMPTAPLGFGIRVITKEAVSHHIAWSHFKVRHI